MIDLIRDHVASIIWIVAGAVLTVAWEVVSWL
jgi:hypothetical protein